MSLAEHPEPDLTGIGSSRRLARGWTGLLHRAGFTAFADSASATPQTALRIGKLTSPPALAVAGAAAAAAVGYLALDHPHADVADVAVGGRVVLILAFVAAALYVQADQSRARLGQSLAVAGLI